MPELKIIDLHMAASHFPMGLLLSSLLFEVMGAYTRRQSLRDTAFWTHVLGAVAAVVTVFLGLLGNPFRNDTGDLAAAVLRHQWMGIASATIFGLLALWRVRARNDIRRPWSFVYWGVTAVGAGVVAVTGYLGGHMMS